MELNVKWKTVVEKKRMNTLNTELTINFLMQEGWVDSGLKG